MEKVEDLKKRISELEEENVKLKENLEEESRCHTHCLNQIKERMNTAALFTNQLIDDLINLIILIQKPKAIDAKLRAFIVYESDEAKDLRSEYLSEAIKFIDKSENIFTSILASLQEYRNEKIYTLD